jgi:glycosyltransferase involved in cell wall biosynthesis
MRVLMLTDSFYPEIGGSETAIWNLSDTLVDLGHTVGVIVISKPNASAPSTKFSFWNVSSRIHGIDLKFIAKVRHVRKIIRDFKPDVMNVHFMLESGYVGVKAAHAEGVPCVLSNRGKGLYNKATNFAESLLYPFWNKGALKADRFIATSTEMADIGRDRYGIQTTVISNGVDTVNFTPEKDGSYLRDTHGVKPGQKVLLCVRRLVPKNGIEYMVRALPAVRKDHDCVLWLASPLIREYEKLKSVAEELGVSEYVRFLGAVDHHDLPFYLSAADVVVQPSIAEARSLACLEAMASGAAIIATATGGLPEIITHGENGYLIPPFQESTYAVTDVFPEGVVSLAKGVSILLSDDTLRTTLKKGARAYAETCSWPNIVRQSLVVYQDAIDQFPTRS